MKFKFKHHIKFQLSSLADKKAREQYGKDQQARANDKYRDKTESLAYIASVGKIAQATAHLV